MILALATALMVAIHVAGAYLGLRGSPIPRKAGVPISLFEAAYWTAAYPYAPLLAAVFAPIRVAGAAAISPASWSGLQRRGGSGHTASTRLLSWRRFCTCCILL
jgi:hypothetical protein